jgi:hypothetical protein
VADLRISELAALAGADLAAGDLLAVADISASESKKITVTDFLGNAVTLIADATIPNAKILFNSASIPGSALQASAVDTTQLADDGVTAAKLADESSVDLVTALPASGAFVGQIALDTTDYKFYCWDGSVWRDVKASGSINTISGSTAGVINVVVSTAGDTVNVSATLDNTAAAAQFLAGPTSAGGAVGYRGIVGTDLPTPTTSAKGGVIVNGQGVRMNDDTLEIDNDVTSSPSVYSVVTYNEKGLITDGRAATSADLPTATSGAIGAVRPGTGLAMGTAGALNHSNTVAASTSTKVTYDAQGHITGGASLLDTDIPSLPASKITTGVFGTDRIADGAITGTRLANSSTALFGAEQPVAEYTGQLYFNSLSRDIYIWDSNVWQPIGISIGEIVFAGTYDANTNQVASVTSDGTAVGLTVGSALPAAAAANNRYYLVVSEGGTGTAPAPTVALAPPDIILSNGSAWVEIDVSQTYTSQTAANVAFSPAGNVSATNVQAAIEELDSEKVGSASPTLTGNVTLSSGDLIFEGSTADAFETTLTVTDPTADRTITLPDVTGTVITTGDSGTVTSAMIADGAIVNADINASAAIAYSKLAALSSGNIIIGSISNVPTAVAVTGDVTISDIGVTSIAAGVIVNADINAAAAIADSKLATISTAGKVSGSAITSGTIGGSTAINTTGTITTTGQTTLKEVKETTFTLATSGSIALDPANGSIQTSVLTGAPTFTDSLEAGQTVVLMIENGASYTVTWPTIIWISSAGNAPPTLTAKDTLVFWKVSTTLYGAYVGSYV